MSTAKASGPSVKPLIDSVARVFVGKPEAVKLTVMTLLARGHLLIEDVPGIGKTATSCSPTRSTARPRRRSPPCSRP
jgi:MoxR-like ATPase